MPSLPHQLLLLELDEATGRDALGGKVRAVLLVEPVQLLDVVRLGGDVERLTGGRSSVSVRAKYDVTVTASPSPICASIA